MKKLFFLFIFLIPFRFLFAQESAPQASLSLEGKIKTDTNYVKSYKDKLIIGLWQSERSFNINIDQKLIAASGSSAINYIANSNHVSGISLDYDIIGLAFGYRSLPGGNSRTGNTDYLDLGFNINTKGLRFENTYKRYTGFYDNNSGNYIHPFNETTNYFQSPSMKLRIVKSKLIYAFSKRKFALGAAYANTKRQVKSKGSWLLVGNFYSLGLSSNSSIIPPQLQHYYGTTWDGLNKMNIFAYSVGLGATYSLVFFKRFYFNFLTSFGLETQFRHLYTLPENTNISYVKIKSAGDWRTSVGYNGKRFFMRLSNIIDLNNYENKDLNFNMKFIAGSFDFGYRFSFKAPKPYQKFQESKIYKLL